MSNIRSLRHIQRLRIQNILPNHPMRCKSMRNMKPITVNNKSFSGRANSKPTL